MNNAIENIDIAYALLKEIPNNRLTEAIDFLSFLKNKNASDSFGDLVEASQSSIDFWLNDEDEVWNNV